MATDNKNSSVPATGLGSQAARDKAKATRAANAKLHVTLGDADRFALTTLLQAKRGCELLAEKIRRGETIDGEAFSAASALSAVACGNMSRK